MPSSNDNKSRDLNVVYVYIFCNIEHQVNATKYCTLLLEEK